MLLLVMAKNLSIDFIYWVIFKQIVNLTSLHSLLQMLKSLVNLVIDNSIV
jgi:hypothetical protein